MPRGYYDIESILMEEERVPCRFLVPAPNVGSLDPAQGKRDFELDDVVELPLWMARVLAQARMVEMMLPKCYHKKAMDQLAAGPEVVNLKSWSPYYYRMGATLALARNDAVLEDKLQKALTGKRFEKLMNASLNCNVEDAGKLSKEMPYTEKLIFSAGHAGAEDYRQWRSREQTILKSSALAPACSKRKRLD